MSVLKKQLESIEQDLVFWSEDGGKHMEVIHKSDPRIKIKFDTNTGKAQAIVWRPNTKEELFSSPFGEGSSFMDNLNTANACDQYNINLDVVCILFEHIRKRVLPNLERCRFLSFREIVEETVKDISDGLFDAIHDDMYNHRTLH